MLSSTAEKRQTIIFHILPSLPYPARVTISGTLFVAGLAAQGYGLLWVGVAAIFAGAILLTIEGYENTVRTRTVRKDWRPVRAEDMTRIIELNKRQRRWDVDAVDISNGLGFVTLAILAAGLGFWSLQMGGLDTLLGRLIACDSAAALLPFWLTGIRSFLKNDQLVVKTDLLLQLNEDFRAQVPSDGQFLFQMQTSPAETGGEVPQDVKAMIQFPDGPEGFLGLQIQIAINSVKGNDYPYAYCVLVAKPGFGLSDKLSRAGVFPGPTVNVEGTAVIVESEVNSEAEVMVFRQETGGGGYHTNAKQARSILKFTLAAARGLGKSS